MAITKPEQHEIDRAGKRLLRRVLEPLRWVVNEVQEDYAIDSNVQVFDEMSPTGAWFHVQLKSSAASSYSADKSFVSQELSVDAAKHYALDLRSPIFLIHADVASQRLFWYAPQLDRKLIEVLGKTGAQGVSVRVPTHHELPGTAAGMLESLDTIYVVLASRELAAASSQSFAESIMHLPDQQALHQAFQEKNDSLKLRNIIDLCRQRKFEEARPRAEAMLVDPDSNVEARFFARIQLEGIEYTAAVHAGRPQGELPKILLAHAKELQKLAASGPNHLRFYSLIVRKAAELDDLVHENIGLSMALHQHLERGGQPIMALRLYAQRSALTRRIVAKYNQCVRLARYAANYPDRWMLGRALVKICYAIGPYLITLRAEGNLDEEKVFVQSALQICKLGLRISEETGDSEAVVVIILGALATADSIQSDGYRWAASHAERVSNPEIRKTAALVIERAVKRWDGEAVDGDYHGNTVWQIIENIASALGIDLSDENDPLVRGLKIAAKDDSPERILRRCEHIIESQGATGPIARQIQRIFNTSMASSKVIHCTLHDFHVEGKELDEAYVEFRAKHCDSCPDQKPRPDDWRYTDAERQTLQAKHREFIARLVGTPSGFRYTDED